MARSLRNLLHIKAALKLRFAAANASAVVVLICAPCIPGWAASSPSATIARARGLALQKDRARSCALIINAIAKEPKGSQGHRDLTRALDELSEVFYSEQGQGAWSLAESLVETKPREAVDAYQASLRAEDGNVASLKGLARAQLVLGDCDRADASIKQAETLNPNSAEIRLLRMQMFECRKSFEAVDALLSARDFDLDGMEKYTKSLQAAQLLRKKDGKKMKSFLTQWEASAPEDPEVYYWKWKVADEGVQSGRLAAVRYSQACQNLSPRKRKAFRFNIDLCKGKDIVDAYLKSAGLQPSTLPDLPPAGGQNQ